MKLKPEVKEKWLKALRSGKYPQTRINLQDESGFCCLGVLCDLYKDDVGGAHWGSGNTSVPFFVGDSAKLVVPPCEVNEWALESGHALTGSLPFGVTLPEEKRFSGDQRILSLSLVELNDSYDYTFPEIADVIEAQL